MVVWCHILLPSVWGNVPELCIAFRDLLSACMGTFVSGIGVTPWGHDWLCWRGKYSLTLLWSTFHFDEVYLFCLSICQSVDIRLCQSFLLVSIVQNWVIRATWLFSFSLLMNPSCLWIWQLAYCFHIDSTHIYISVSDSTCPYSYIAHISLHLALTGKSEIQLIRMLFFFFFFMFCLMYRLPRL